MKKKQRYGTVRYKINDTKKVFLYSLFLNQFSWLRYQNVRLRKLRGGLVQHILIGAQTRALSARHNAPTSLKKSKDTVRTVRNQWHLKICPSFSRFALSQPISMVEVSKCSSWKVRGGVPRPLFDRSSNKTAIGPQSRANGPDEIPPVVPSRVAGNLSKFF